MKKILEASFAFFFLFTFTTAQENILTPENGFKGEPTEMMRRWLLDEIAVRRAVWESDYEKLKIVDEVKKYQAERKEFFFTKLGKTWDRNSPLNAKVTKTLDKGTPGKNSYRVELVVFESVPNFFVTAAVYLPDPERFKPPYPGVLVLCGHAVEGKASKTYQRVPALVANHGVLTMIMDPIDQGERMQRLTSEGKAAAHTVPAHNILGQGSILLGRNTATFMVWDMIRALDYLQSRPDVDPERLGATGNSGGGTQTSYIMALDERVKAAAPSCYLCGLYDKMANDPQDAEQVIHAQLDFGMDHADYCIMRAPLPTLIESATKDFFPIDDTWKAFRKAKRIYDRFGYAEKMEIIEHDAPHGWNRNQREAAVRWMLRWLADRDEQVFEPDDLPIFEIAELNATEKGQVMFLDGARSAFDLNRDYNDELLAARKTRNENRDRIEFAEMIRKTIGTRPVADIPAYEIEAKSENVFVLKTESGKIQLPVLRFSPQSGDLKGTTVFLHENGKTADMPKIESLVAEGQTVIAVDLRGLGETKYVGPKYYDHNLFDTDGSDQCRAYLLGKSYVGMRTEDLLAVARWIGVGQNPTIYASGETVGLVALHAAVLEPAMFSGVKLEKPVRSWYDVVDAGCSFYPMTNLVHGGLLEYDVPDLMRLAEVKE